MGKKVPALPLASARKCAMHRGALAEPACFASKAANPAGADGRLFGNPAQRGIQLVAVAVTLGLRSIGAFILFNVVGVLVGLRVSEEDEIVGRDLSHHGETACMR
jgi:ammonium transporter, Amt family